MQQEETRKCPFCAELIKKEAIKCRFCGSDLTVDGSSDLSAKNSTISNPKIGKNKMIMGVLLTILGFIIMIAFIDSSSFLVVMGALATLSGLVYVGVGKFQNWYHWK